MPARSRLREWRFALLLASIDIIGCTLVWFAAGMLTELGSTRNEFINGGVMVALYVALAWTRAVYDPGRHSSAEGAYLDVLRSWAVAVLLFAFGSLLARGFFVDRPARIVLLIVGGAATLWGWRVVQAKLLPSLATHYVLPRRVLVIGSDSDSERVRDLYGRRGSERVQLLGYCDDREYGALEQPSLPYLGSIDRVPRLVEDLQIDDVLIAFPWSAAERITTAMRVLRFLPVRVLLSPERILLSIPPTGFTRSYGFAAPLLSRPPIAQRWWWIKEVIDRCGAALLLLLLSPVFLAVMLAIRLEGKGPVFFRQDRLGLNQHPFRIWKFRTLRPESADPDVARQVTRGDARVTRVGRVLRKFSIDELPQLLNVLTGDMSLVGPRPHAPGTKAAGIVFAEAIPDYAIRYRVKPGMTGWAQVNGWRGDTNTVEKLQFRIDYDHYYIANWSLALDVLILLRTPGAVASARNSV